MVRWMRTRTSNANAPSFFIMVSNRLLERSVPEESLIYEEQISAIISRRPRSLVGVVLYTSSSTVQRLSLSHLRAERVRNLAEEAVFGG